MSTFRIEIASEDAAETIAGVESFVGGDESGSFGILANHEPLVTALSWGLCRLRTMGGNVQYLAFPGGILSFDDNVLTIATQHFLREDDSSVILEKLDERMRSERKDRQATREMLHNLDRELLRRLLKKTPISA